MSVHPPDALDLVTRWREEAVQQDAAVKAARTIAERYDARLRAHKLRDFADQLERHMQGVTP